MLSIMFHIELKTLGNKNAIILSVPIKPTMPNAIMLIVVKQSDFLLNVENAECYAGCHYINVIHYEDCHYAECHSAEFHHTVCHYAE